MDIVHLLPDSVANQIAAGEVIQRPASVVKELVENAIDAGASVITVVVKGAGRTSIQVTDNGRGMSATDARIAFERHATSKIARAEDLFAIQTMGFRGEALASIAAVAQVELRTRQAGDDVGTWIEIAGSKVERQEMVQCAGGTTFVVKNLFYNIPVRRKFLKSDETEMRNVIQEMQRMMLAHADVAFKLYNGDDVVYDVAADGFKQRIVSIFDRRNRNISKQLLNVDADTTLVRIHGFVGTPQSAGRNTPQFFFVNGRYMNHPYFRRAVLQAYERMVAPDDVPLYFLNLTVDPAAIDVNIHPTKTEIKFENEREIWSIISIAVREALGKFNITPSIDFNTEGMPDFPSVGTAGADVAAMPDVAFDPKYNPFEQKSAQMPGGGHSGGGMRVRNWQQLFDGACRQSIPFPDEPKVRVPTPPATPAPVAGMMMPSTNDSIVHRGRYVCMSLKSGLLLVDVVRAAWRVYYDDLMRMIDVNGGVTQKLLFPEVIEMTADDRCLLTEMECELRSVGFVFAGAGDRGVCVEGVPAILTDDVDVAGVIDMLLRNVKDGDRRVDDTLRQVIARTLSYSAAMKRSAVDMTPEERTELVGRLFASANPNFTPEGETILTILGDEEIGARFRV